MNRTAVIVLGAVVAIVVAALAFPRLARAFSANAALSRCAELKAQRAAVAVQGGDVVTLARLDAEIRACSQDAAALGADVDLGSVTLAACTAKYEQIAQEMAHYRSTDYSDTVKRQNTRGTIFRLGEEMARCYETAVADADSVDTLDQIRNSIARTVSAAQGWERCFRDQASGCGRFFGSTDTFPPEVADAFLTRMIAPLRAAHAAATAKRDGLRRATTSTPLGVAA